jgi:nicotinamidase-related amidase
MGHGLKKSLGNEAVHLSVDMQKLFDVGGPWPTPWLSRTLPQIVRLVEARPQQTIFTRFIPPTDAGDLPGTWERYYRRWEAVTLRRVDPDLLDLLPPLAAHAPPSPIFDKSVYSAFGAPGLEEHLDAHGFDTLIITGVETDVCVLATVLDAVDRGLRVVIVMDGICSSSDAGHDALMTQFRTRFSEQIEVADLETVKAEWR